ncbi:MAG: hypothetical protein ACI8W8_004581 [Rhodothermales bacterium]|jgi:hypothetical protein
MFTGFGLAVLLVLCMGLLNKAKLYLFFAVMVGAWANAGEPPTKLGGMTRAKAKQWWAFRGLPPADSANPATIDRFLGTTAAESADRRTLLRRASYDLTGLPPTAKEVATFVADPAPDAIDRLIDRLLGSPDYGVKWGRHWLDVVRYADTAGENTDRPLPHAWRYRNWVMQAFNQDLPYDDFVRLQLAGDIVAAAAPEQQRQAGIVATGYLAIARRFGHEIDKDVHLMHEDVIDNLGKSFLGLTIACARCHDHKYDPVSARDYYALYGIFASTRFSYPGCEAQGKPRDLVPLNTGRAPSILASGQVDEGASAEFAKGQLSVRKGEVLQLAVLPNGNYGADSTRVQWRIEAEGQVWRLADLIDSLTEANPLPDKGASWCFLAGGDSTDFLPQKKDALDGHGELRSWSYGDPPSVFVNRSDKPVAVWTELPGRTFFVHPGPKRPVVLAWVSPRDAEVSIRGLVADAHPSGGDGVSFQLTHLASPQAGADLLAGKTRAQVAMAYAVAEGESKDSQIHHRGDPADPGDVIPRRWLEVFGGDLLPTDSGSGRQQLADWIAGHPLAARVMVNRIWQWHFGVGLVATPNDFGSRGKAPANPELLDWLAAQFVSSGFRVKAMHRLIMGSAAYQRRHFPRRRLSAEELRDSLLALSGQLDRKPGQAHPFPPVDSWKFTQHNPFSAVYDSKKRSAYLMVQRQRRHPFLALFDGADPNASTGQRQTTNVPAQALYFLNDAFFHTQAAAIADRLPDDETRITQAYQTVLQRLPTDNERARTQAFVANYAAPPPETWAAYLRVLLASNEFVHID